MRELQSAAVTESRETVRPGGQAERFQLARFGYKQSETGPGKVRISSCSPDRRLLSKNEARVKEDDRGSLPPS